MIRPLTLSLLLVAATPVLAQPVTSTGVANDPFQKTPWIKADGERVQPNPYKQPTERSAYGLGLLIRTGQLSPAGPGDRSTWSGNYDPASNRVQIHAASFTRRNADGSVAHTVTARYVDEALFELELGPAGLVARLRHQTAEHNVLDGRITELLRAEVERNGDSETRCHMLRGWTVQIDQGGARRHLFLPTHARATWKGKPDRSLWLVGRTPKSDWIDRAHLRTDGGDVKGPLLGNLRIHRYHVETGDRLLIKPRKKTKGLVGWQSH